MPRDNWAHLDFALPFSILPVVSKVIDEVMEKYNYSLIRTPAFESSSKTAPSSTLKLR